MRNFFALIFVLLALAIPITAIGRMQSISARGRVTCNGSPVGGLKMKLMDHDTFTPSDLMAQTTSDNDGSFRLSGHKTEFTSITPEIRIYHKCGHTFFR